MSNIIFISDLHLLSQHEGTMALFSRFIKEVATEADVLYILGDLLEYWLGDDDPAPDYQKVFSDLKSLPEEHGTKIFLMHGNRDFLIGNKLAEQCGFTLIEDPTVIDLNGNRTLLMHGDTLCTDDVDYQQFRSMVRNPEWQKEVLRKSLEERLGLAMSLRQTSQQSTSEKEEYIMDVNAGAVEQAFIENDVDIIIHGHTHRPDIHRYEINRKEAIRIVLGDWHDSARYLSVSPDQAEFALSTFK